MEKEKQSPIVCKKPPETDYVLQWGNRKRHRHFRVRSPNTADPSTGGRARRKITSKAFTAVDKQNMLLQTTRLTRNSESATLRSENRKSASPEKEDRYYTTRGSAGGFDEIGKALIEGGERGFGDERRGLVWPKLFISLSTKEKEEDFMAMKGCKLPQRPKKRAKLIQRTLLLVSPGAWLSDMCQERYEVREKKSSKKRPRGLKAMGSMESDSE